MAKKLLDQLREELRLKHYSYRTEQAYVDWVRRFILFHNKRHPAEMGAPEIRAFLAHLAQERNVSASTQNQALSAVLFLCREVLHKEIEPVLLSTAKRPQRLPSVLTRQEVLTLLEHLSGTFKLMAQLLYGSGLRRMECVRLRIQDVDFEYKIGLTQLAGRDPHIWRVIGQNTPYMAVRMTQLGPNCVTPNKAITVRGSRSPE
jgi:site-specific recombinase XerD